MNQRVPFARKALGEARNYMLVQYRKVVDFWPRQGHSYHNLSLQHPAYRAGMNC